MADDQQTNPFGLPNFDLEAMLKQFQIPGVDLSSIIENERKNIEALQQANQAVVDGIQALAQKQAEVFKETMERWQQSLADGNPESAQEGIEQALDNVRQLAEITVESQTKAFEVIRQRVEENMQNLFNRSSGD
jgi:phasin family protein